MSASGVAVSPTGKQKKKQSQPTLIYFLFLLRAGQCFTQSWCDDLLAATGDGQIACRISTGVVVGSRGRPVMALSVLGAQQTSAGRCVSITAICSRRGRIELPCQRGSGRSMLSELWPSPDGGSAVAVHCADGNCLKLTRGGYQWPSTLLTVNTTSPFVTEPQCQVTAAVLADTVFYETPAAPAQFLSAAMTNVLYTITVHAISDQFLAVVIDSMPTADSFCILWYFAVLAMRGARVKAVNGYTIALRPTVSSTMCFDIALSGDKTTLLLQTDALASAVGTVVGISINPNFSAVYTATGTLDNTLPLSYRLLTPHVHMLQPPFYPQATAIYDTAGVIRALVAPSNVSPPIILDGWLPFDPFLRQQIEFADDTAIAASLCYLLAGNVTLTSPVIETDGTSSVAVHLPGMSVQVAMFPPAALVEPGAPFYVINDTARVETVPVDCGDTTFLMPAVVGPTYCVTTAGVQNVGLISTIWRNESAEPFLSETLAGCNLVSHHSVFGIQISDEFCVPVSPATTISVANVGICASILPEDRASDALSVEITRQMGLPSTLPPFIHADAVVYNL